MAEKNKTPQSLGGDARNEKLSAAERSEIAKKGASARWGDRVPKATHYGELELGELTIPCAVLEDGTRVLTQQGFYMAIGRSGKPARGRGSQVEKIAPFLDLNNLKPFVDEDLEASTKPIVFRVPSGSRAYGYRAELLPRVCEVYLKARDQGELLKSQMNMAKACEILMRALAHVGIVALVDEATGYQYERSRKALAEILEAFIKDEAGKWAKRFPDAFYAELFRLKDKPWPIKKNPPQYVGHWTNNVVYKRLAPGVLEDLRKKNPRRKSGSRKTTFHQWLTDDIGHPKLQEHIQSVLALMRASDTWDQFEKMLDRALPKQPQTATERAQKRLAFSEDE